MDKQSVQNKKRVFEKAFFKLLRATSHSFFSLLHLRPGSSPYITGDSFRKLADYVFDEVSSFDPTEVKLGDVVFVGNTKMVEFFTRIHPHIQQQYILIQHNGDFMVDENIAAYIDEKIIRFYAQIPLVKHPKIIPIPIGISNKHHGIEVFGWQMNKPQNIKRQPRIFYRFFIATNPKERTEALNFLAPWPFADTIIDELPNRTYKKVLSSYCFAASPAGNTLGSHRTWEALYFGCIPIVKRTADAESHVSLGLPLWIIDNWNDLSDFDEFSLQRKYDTMMHEADFSALYMDYWKKRILADQLAVQKIYE